jgi:hypothetical protein
VLRNQTSLYAKIDIFFPVHGKWLAGGGAQSETNVKWPAREVFRSLDATLILPTSHVRRTRAFLAVDAMTIEGKGPTAGMRKRCGRPTVLRCVKGPVAAHAGAGAVGSHNSEMISMVCS